MNARAHCYEKIESALENIYNFASYVEYDKSIKETSRKTKLQESFECTARLTELEERQICRDSKVILERRTSNIAILCRHQLQTNIMVNNIPAKKLMEYDRFPLAHRAGLIHSIPEEILSIDSATITDVNFLGLFPKSSLSVLRSYKNQLKKDLPSDFNKLIAGLIPTVIYWPLTIQRIIHYILAAIKLQIENDCKQRQLSTDTNTDLSEAPLPTPSTKSKPTNTPSLKICHAKNFAKGILCKPASCAKGRNMRSGCISEGTCQQKVVTLEIEIMEANTPNLIFAPILDCISKAISIKKL